MDIIYISILVAHTGTIFWRCSRVERISVSYSKEIYIPDVGPMNFIIWDIAVIRGS